LKKLKKKKTKQKVVFLSRAEDEYKAMVKGIFKNYYG
jgi:hypothetical protein